MSTVKFGTPPAKPRRELARLQAAELRDNPQQAGLIRTYPASQMRSAHNYAHKINKGLFPAFKGCRARAVTIDGNTEVWAEYVGGEA